MNRKIKKVLKTIAGMFLILIGIIGLFLPILQGIVLIVLGVSLINPILSKKIIKKAKRFYYRFKDNIIGLFGHERGSVNK